MFDEMVLGIQNYYRIATCISLDCRRVHRKIMTVLTNRLKTESGGQLIREGGVMTESEKERYGKSKMIRYVSGINRPIYPIAFVKYKPATLTDSPSTWRPPVSSIKTTRLLFAAGQPRIERKQQHRPETEITAFEKVKPYDGNH